MQTHHLYIIAIGSVLGFVLMAYFIHKAIQRAWNRGFDAGHNTQRGRIANLRQTLDRFNGIIEVNKQELATLQGQVQRVKTPPFTMDDHQTLMDIAQMLRVAHDTWKAIPNTGPMQLKAANLTKHAQALAYRVFGNVTSATALNGEPLDTQLIEWLNKRGVLLGDLESSTIDFPHPGATNGYPHLREALREAYELDQQLQARDLGEPAEDAA
ncbi:hypothetical protein [Pseudomonas chlororaphis]|uniref:hypothetical protein n=1 Tax=Pseudomonas chlororaphis TaxID=587753 RepID=UPI000F58A655|nr:hypothetical protein [Pseudomonas chlororaphis]AZC55408.1 hypothetical protein C4K34_1224 [Pseudomonas chlororaphis subsp. piscium]